MPRSKSTINLPVEVGRELAGKGKFTPRLASSYLDRLSEHGSYDLAAAQCGINRATARQWRKDSEAFSMACDASLAVDAVQSIDTVKRMSKSKSDAVALNAAKSLLARNPITSDAWSESASQGGQGGPNIQVVINVDRSTDPFEPIDKVIDITPDKVVPSPDTD